MEYVKNELREVNNKMFQLQMMIERGGNREHIEKVLKIVGAVHELRVILEEDRKSPSQLLAEELARAIDEVVETTGTSLSEVLDQAKEIYDNHIEEVRDLERRKRVVNDLFKGW